MRTAITTSDYIFGQKVLQNMTSTASHEDYPIDTFVRLSSFITEQERQLRPNTDFLHIYHKEPRTDTIDFIKAKIKLFRGFHFRENPDDLYCANIFRNTVVDLIATSGLDKGVSHTLKTLKDQLLNCEYSKCDTFIQLLEDSMPEFDLRLHICVLTLTSHWKDNLTVRSSYYSCIEEFVNNSFEDMRAKQILFGLK